MLNLATFAKVLTTSETKSQSTDLDLIEQLRNHDEVALITLYRRYSSLVYSIAMKILGNQQDAEEITQDVFLRLWQKADQFDPNRGKFIAWLATTTRNSAIDYFRKHQRSLSDQTIVSLDVTPQLWETIQIEDEDYELRSSIASAIYRLTTEQQEAIALAYFYGMSQSEIAEYLKRPLGTVKSHIRQGMQRLRQIWLSEET